MASALGQALVEADLVQALPEVQALASPRRLVLHVAEVRRQRPAREEVREGPRRAACFDDQGQPTRALEGFARGAGLPIADVTFAPSSRGKNRGEVAVARLVVPGEEATSLLPDLILRLLRGVPFPKTMRWEGRDLTFARPIRSLCLLLGPTVVELEVAGLRSGREVQGHPFLASGTIALQDANLEAYLTTLEERCVLVSGVDRRERIREAIEATGLAVDLDPDLLEEVANLVEWPGVGVGSFDPRFLELPEEVLIEPMKGQQRYFPVRRHATGPLDHRFVVVHNRGPAGDPVIVEGNEAVLRARLSDARFFFEADCQRPLESLVPRLGGVLFREGLGTMEARARRLEELAGQIAHRLDGSVPLARRAGLLAKTDLVTEMVYEFPELQGAMGGIYGRLQGEEEVVARAVELHYGPRQEDPLPEDPVAVALCLAEKLDGLVAATLTADLGRGSRDPFGTRRDAIAVIRILYEGAYPLRLSWLVAQAGAGYVGVTWGAPQEQELLGFLRDRLEAHMRDAGHDHERVAAVLATDADDLAGVRSRLAAVERVAATPVWPLLVEAVERCRNITRQYEGDSEVDPELLQEPQEITLHEALRSLQGPFEQLVAAGELEAASARYAEVLATPLSEFFDSVFVNVEDEPLRKNRMALLQQIHQLHATRIADLSLVNLKRERAQDP